MAFSSSQTLVAQLFQAAFNRAPSAVTPFEAWVARYDANIAAGKTAAESQLITLQEMTSTGESSTIYGSLTAAQAVDLMWSNSLGRAFSSTEAQTTWADFYTANGVAATINAMVTTALTGPNSATDKATLEAAAAAADAALYPTTTPGSTFTLTTGTDAFSPTATEATSQTTTGDDTIDGVVSGLTSTNTLNGTDVVDGGDGTDTLKLDLNANFGGMTAGTDSVKNVEVLDMTNGSTLSRTVDTTGISGLTTVNVDTADQSITIADLESTDLTLNITNADEAKTVSLTYATLNNVNVNAGSTDSLTLGLTDVGTAKVVNATTGATTTAQKTLSVTAAGIESLAIQSNGTSNFVNAAIGTATSVTLTGAASTSITALDAETTSFDGSAATGAVTLDGTAATALSSVKTGTMDDTITVDAMNVEATIAAGTGSDTLILNNLAAGTYQPTMTGVETVQLKAQANAFTISGASSTDLTAIEVKEGLAAAATMTFAGFTSPTMAINLTDTKDTADVNNGGTISYTGATALTINATTNNTAGTTTTYNDAITAATATSVAVDVAKDVIMTGAVTTAAATSATVNVAKGGSYTTGALTTASATSLTINAEGTMSNAVVAAKATTVTVTSGASSNFTSKITAAKATTVNATSTDTDAMVYDLIVDAATTVSVNTKSATTFAGTADFSSVSSMTLASTSSMNTTGAVALGDKSKSVTIDATNVKGALTTTVDNYTSGGGTANVSGSTLGVNTVIIGTGRNEVTVTGGISDDSVTLNQVFTATDEVSMSFNLGTVSLSDTVTFGNASDITNGNVTFVGVDNIAATTLTLDASSVTGQTVLFSTATGNITLKGTSSGETIDMSKVTTKGGGNFLVIDAGDGADTITDSAENDAITGGAGADTFNITKGADTISDLGAGTSADVVKLSAGATVVATATGNWTATSGTQNLGSAAADFEVKPGANVSIDLTAATVTTAASDGFKLTAATAAGTT